MSTIQFSHANGFPAACYGSFFSFLKPHKVRSVPVLSLGEARFRHSREHMVKGLASHLSTLPKGEKVVGLGHSLGGVINLLCYHKYPEHFEKLILLDCPIFHPAKLRIIGLFRRLGLIHRLIPQARKTLKRRDHFSTRKEAHAHFQKRTFFRHFHPQCLNDYVQHGLREKKEGRGLELVIDKHTEYRIFASPPYCPPKLSVQVPCYYVCATRERLLSKRDFKALARLIPNIQFIPFRGGHMFPLEKPKEAAELVKEVLRQEV